LTNKQRSTSTERFCLKHSLAPLWYAVEKNSGLVTSDNLQDEVEWTYSQSKNSEEANKKKLSRKKK